MKGLCIYMRASKTRSRCFHEIRAQEKCFVFKKDKIFISEKMVRCMWMRICGCSHLEAIYAQGTLCIAHIIKVCARVFEVFKAA